MAWIFTDGITGPSWAYVSGSQTTASLRLDGLGAKALPRRERLALRTSAFSFVARGLKLEAYPKALRPRISKLLGPRTVSYWAFGLC